MKVLWIMYAPLGQLSKILGFGCAQSGTWTDSAMDSLLEADSNVELTVLTTAKIKEIRRKNENGVEYVCLNLGRCLRGKSISKAKLNIWLAEIKRINPDVIHLWGTEFSLGYYLKKLLPEIPFLYTMQGVMTYISKYPYLDLHEMKKKISLVSKLKCYKYIREQVLQKRQAHMEKTIITEADGVIADNEWAVAPFINEQNASKFHFIRLPIKKQFQAEKWNYADVRENTLFCIAGRSGLKGIHQLVKAVHLLKQDFPDIRVLIPGNISNRKPDFLFKPPYMEYLRNLIREYGLEENVCFLGQLTTEDMIAYMKTAKVFVMPSAIENESSTLREAMFLGMPIITSCVGDIHEVISHGENGLMYRFEEYEMLAYHIRYLLKYPEKSTFMADKAREHISLLYENQIYGVHLFRVYQTLKR